MRQHQRRPAHGRVRTALLGAAGLALTAVAAPAHAALGHAHGSVEADRAHFAAKMSATAASGYTVQTLALANGGLTREFERGDGVVFAVTWRGPGRPDLRQLLGDEFSTFQADNGRVGMRHIRKALTVNRPDFVVRSGGHPGAFRGFAYLPRLAPSGFDPSNLNQG